MLNLPAIFEEATISQQHAILNKVFKHALTFSGGAFRTPWVHPEFRDNLQRLKQLGLLEVEQPYGDNLILSFMRRGRDANRTPYTFFDLFRWLKMNNGLCG